MIHGKSLIYKTLIYRVLAITGSMIVAFVVTGMAEVSLAIGLWELIGKSALYYGFERIWGR